MIRLRTSYSFRRAVGSLDKALERVQECRWPKAPITDHCSPYGWVKWNKLCKAKDIPPVFGVELPVSPDPTAKKPIWDGWVFLATEELAPLNELIELATKQFRYRPLLTYQQAIMAEGVHQDHRAPFPNRVIFLQQKGYLTTCTMPSPPESMRIMCQN